MGKNGGQEFVFPTFLLLNQKREKTKTGKKGYKNIVSRNDQKWISVILNVDRDNHKKKQLNWGQNIPANCDLYGDTNGSISGIINTLLQESQLTQIG